jgi:replicative DNA helicase
MVKATVVRKFANDTQIVITEYNAAIRKFQVINRVEIPRGEFTFDHAVKKIIELNDTYNPRFLYIDAGYGEAQIETLRKYGKDHPESGLDKKVKRIQFSQKIPVVDPATREIDNKDAKNFMINQTSIILERNQLVLSLFDDMIWKQMMNYQVVRISQTGKPIYTSVNEHSLDAMMLTILGFTIEYPELTKIIDKPEVARTSHAVNQTHMKQKLINKVFGHDRPVFDVAEPKKKFEEKDPYSWRWQSVPLGYRPHRRGWGRRGHTPGGFRRTKI